MHAIIGLHEAILSNCKEQRSKLLNYCLILVNNFIIFNFPYFLNLLANSFL